MKKYLLFICLFILFNSCSSPQIKDTQLRRKAAAIQILKVEEVKTRKYSIVKEVKGYSCGRQLGSDPSIDAARNKLRINAAKLDADAIINVICEETGVSWVYNCWKTIECRGDAIKFTNN